MVSSTDYDFIIAGAGCAGLSMAWHLAQSPLRTRRILLLDRSLAPIDDKEWCFWGPGTLPFAEVACKTWDRMTVGFPGRRVTEPLPTNPYHCVRSQDYHTYVHAALDDCRTLDRVEADIHAIRDEDDGAVVHTSAGTFRARYVFQSCLLAPGDRDRPVHYPLRQHFGGWEITAAPGSWDDSVATLMDFDADQHDGTGFFYCLPFSTDRMLVEYTLFSPTPLPQTAYDDAVRSYLDRLGIHDYAIDRREYGCLPMEDRPLSQRWGQHVFNLGAVGGMLKPTTGYAFQRTHRQVRRLVDTLVQTGTPQPAAPSTRRFRFYDLLLLHILHETPEHGRSIFRRLFLHNPIDRVLQFIGEETHLGQDALIFRRLPYRLFLGAIPPVLRSRVAPRARTTGTVLPTPSQTPA